MSTRAAQRSFPAQLLVALARTSPAYTAGLRPGRSRGRQLLAALGRGPVVAQHTGDPEAASPPSASPSDESIPAAPGQGSGSEVADLLWSLPPATRLSLRSHPAVLSTAVAFRTRLARDLAYALDKDLARVLDILLSGALAPALAHAPARAHGLARDLVRASVRARAYARGRHPDLILDRDRVLSPEDELSREGILAVTLIRDLARDRDLARNLARNLPRWRARELVARDLPRRPDRDPADGLDFAHEVDLERARDRDFDRTLARVLDRALDDFTGADLHEADLAGLSLTGVRWSRATQWPSAWVEEIERLSVEVEPGIFEIRGGTATVDMSPDLVGV